MWYLIRLEIFSSPYGNWNLIAQFLLLQKTKPQETDKTVIIAMVVEISGVLCDFGLRIVNIPLTMEDHMLSDPRIQLLAKIRESKRGKEMLSQIFF